MEPQAPQPPSSAPEPKRDPVTPDDLDYTLDDLPEDEKIQDESVRDEKAQKLFDEAEQVGLNPLVFDSPAALEKAIEERRQELEVKIPETEDIDEELDEETALEQAKADGFEQEDIFIVNGQEFTDYQEAKVFAEDNGHTTIAQGRRRKVVDEDDA